MLAPFTPFLAEELYQNLMGAAADKQLSVHLDDYPAPVPERDDPALRRTVAALRHVVTLGQRVRAEHKLKVRQPLRRAIVLIANAAERSAVATFAETIRAELNVHEVELQADAAAHVQRVLVPNFRVLGPKLGPRMPLCKQALLQADGDVLHAQMQSRGNAKLRLSDGSEVTLTADDIEIRLQARDGYAAAADRDHVVLLDTQLDDALRLEGVAREIINRIQRARKERDLPYDARIRIHHHSQGVVAQALEKHGAQIAAETLAVALIATKEPGDSTQHESTATPSQSWQRSQVEGSALAVWLEVV